MAEVHKPNIYQRIAAVMADVGYVQKDGKIKGGPGYTYVRHDDVVRKLRPAIIKHGLVALASVVPESVTQDGNRTTAITELRVVNTDNPNESVTVHALGYGIDPQDKGPGKAASYGKKYALLQLFMLETGDDPEQDAIEYNARVEPEQPKAAEPEPTPPPAEPAQASHETAAERKQSLVSLAKRAGAPLADVAKYLAYHYQVRKFEALPDELQVEVLTDWAEKAELVKQCVHDGVRYGAVFQSALEAMPPDSRYETIHCATVGQWRAWLEEAESGGNSWLISECHM